MVIRAMVLVLATVVGTSVQAAEISILSAGAPEPGIHAVIELFKAKGNTVTVRYATAPAIRKIISENGGANIVVAPPAVIKEVSEAGKVDGKAQVLVGKVGVGITVRQGAPVPDVSTVDKMKAALLAAETVVYNQASTGNYLQELFGRLGIAEQLAPKTKRYPDGDGVMAHIIKGSGTEIGLGAITEINQYTSKGLRFVGPLPSDVQNYTSYVAAPMTGANHSADSAKFLELLATPEARKALLTAGIE
jgi:molybdate transport system substrate-binding protein